MGSTAEQLESLGKALANCSDSREVGEIERRFKACPKHSRVLAYRTSSDGKRMHCWVCPTCGERSGSWVAAKSLSDFEKAGAQPIEKLEKGHPVFTAYRKRVTERCSEKRAFLFRSRGLVMRAEYADYLKSPEWGNTRHLIMARAKGVCEGCLKERAVQVHHLTYDHATNPFAFELVALCRNCHERWHHINERGSTL